MRKQCVLMFLACVIAPTARSQPLLSPRAVALGAYDTEVKDIRGFAANPAGLIFMKGWDFHTTTYLTTPQSGSGFVFNGFGFGRSISDDYAAAIQYSPGALQEFSIPSAERINGQTIASATKVSYQEEFAVGAARRMNDNLSLGLGLRVRTAIVNDPQFQLQLKDSSIVPVPNQFQITTWLLDPAAYWKPRPDLSLSAVARGLVSFSKGSFPALFTDFGLPGSRSLEIGAGYDPSMSSHISGQFNTLGSGAVGMEWTPVPGISVRGGIYLSTTGTRFINALSIGGGWSYQFLDVDLAYLRFTDQSNRSGSAPVAALDVSQIRNVSMNPYTSDRVVFAVKASFGSLRESVTHIENVKILAGIYPSASNAFVYNPLGVVTVMNVSRKPVQVKASLFIDHLMDSPTETPAETIPAGDRVDIPLMAIFNDQLKAVTSAMVRDADVRVIALSSDDTDDRIQARVLIHGRNEWDGNIMSLRYFVTPGDPDVIRYTRDILLSMRDSLSGVPREMESFRKAKLLFDAFAGKLMYVNDPKLTANYVQYPSETLSLRGGDCDDMTVCFASLLASIGVSCAFVDVVPPDHPEDSHIYLLFDTGIDPGVSKSLSNNPKRYVVRKNSAGKETLWIAIESTVITHGFVEAWSRGAEEHFQHTDVDLGLIKGWVKVVDVY